MTVLTQIVKREAHQEFFQFLEMLQAFGSNKPMIELVQDPRLSSILIHGVIESTSRQLEEARLFFASTSGYPLEVQQGVISYIQSLQAMLVKEHQRRQSLRQQNLIAVQSRFVADSLAALSPGEQRVIGRKGQITIHPGLTEISRWHATVQRNGNTYILEDGYGSYGSRHGTYFQNQNGSWGRVTRRIVVKPGNRICLGKPETGLEIVIPKPNRDYWEHAAQQTYEQVIDEYQAPFDAREQQSLETWIPVRTLIRDPEQQNVDPHYHLNCADARLRLIEGLSQGEYKTLDGFMTMLHQAHALSYHGKSGDRLYYTYTIRGTDQPCLLSARRVKPGQFRQGGSLINYRLNSAQQIEKLAKELGDPYRVKQDSTVRLPGIPNEGLPLNGKDGSHRYPKSRFIMDYVQQMHRHLLTWMSTDWEQRELKEALAPIAAFYQYAANARPYCHINNSLFMNLVNLLLNQLGLNGVSHGVLDHAAQRLQPDAFERLFYRTVLDARQQEGV